MARAHHATPADAAQHDDAPHRAKQRGWPASDPLYVDAKAAREAMHRLHMPLRELSRLRHVTSQERRPWEPGGSARNF